MFRLKNTNYDARCWCILWRMRPNDPTHLNLVTNASETALRFNIIRPLKRTLTVY